MDVTQELVRARYDYDPETGLKRIHGSCVRARGSDGYVVLSINYRRYRVHLALDDR
jgi:hypothetical protein